jgi:hypothetical protein
MRLAPDYQRQSSAESSSSSCSNITTQQSHESKPCPTLEEIFPSEQCTITVTSSTQCSDKSRCHCTEETTHTAQACTTDNRCPSTCSGQQEKRRPQSLECKRKLSGHDGGLLGVAETDSDQSNSTAVSPVISVEENQDYETTAIHSISQISRSPSLSSTCSLSLPTVAAGVGGGKQAVKITDLTTTDNMVEKCG